MNTKEDQLCMDVLAAIAWADGEVSVAEAEKVVDLIDRMEYVDHHRVQEAMFVPHNAPSVAQLGTLEKKMRVRLLHDAYVVAEFCGSPSFVAASTPPSWRSSRPWQAPSSTPSAGPRYWPVSRPMPITNTQRHVCGG